MIWQCWEDTKFNLEIFLRASEERQKKYEGIIRNNKIYKIEMKSNLKYIKNK